MQITSLDITLRRINQIETRFNKLNSLENGVSDFSKVLDKTLETKKTDTIETKSISNKEIDNLINKYSQENNIDKNLVKAVVKAESNFNENAKSRVGALGLMQLMPATANSLGVENPLDPEQNIKGGTKYLKSMMDKFNGDVKNALAAYNAGPSAVNKYGGIPPYSETQNYVKKVLEFQEKYKA